MKQHLKPILPLVFLLASGLASAKPPLPEAMYASSASDWVAIHRCGAAGKMPPETAALGVSYIKLFMSKHDVDTAKMNSLVSTTDPFQAGTPPDQVCNTLAMKILEVRQHQLAAEREKAAAPTVSSAPKNTVCNQAFGQTYCTTY